MAMLTHSRDLHERYLHSPPRHDATAARSAAAHLATTARVATIKRFCARIFVGLALGATLAAVIALKTVLFLGFVHYY